VRDEDNEANPMGLPIYSVNSPDEAEELMKLIGERASDGNFYCTLPEFNHDFTDLWETHSVCNEAYRHLQEDTEA
jgi:hypothetical protein